MGKLHSGQRTSVTMDEPESLEPTGEVEPENDREDPKETAPDYGAVVGGGGEAVRAS